jgi:hypothetical protein
VSTFTIAHGQTLKVLVSKGANKVKTGSSWQTLKPGSEVSSDDEIEVTSGGYVGLIHNSSGKTFEFQKPGKYPVGKYVSQIASKGDDNYAAKYAGFVVDRMTSEDGGRRNYNVAGAVNRGPKGEIDILLPIPDNESSVSIFTTQPLYLHWEAKENVDTYQVVLKALDDKPVFKTTTKNNWIKIDAKELDKVPGNIILEVTDAADGDVSIQNRLLSTVDKNKEKAILSDLEKLNADSESALGNLIIGKFFAENGYSVYAIHHFAKASELQPEVDAFDYALTEYLIEKKICEPIKK